MKRKRLVAVCLVMLLLAGLFGIYTLAQQGNMPPTVVLDYAAKKFVFRNVTPYEGNVYPNLFANEDFTGMMPGDSVAQEIAVTAKNLDGGYAEIYLYAESLNEDITAEEAANWDLLMENATVLVSWTGNDGRRYHDELEAANGRVHLGTFHEDDEVSITVDFGFDIEAGNELQFLRAEVGWVFVAEVFEQIIPTPTPTPEPTPEPTPTPTPTPEPTPTPTPGGPIPDEPTPDEPEPSTPVLEREDHFAYIIGREDGLVHPEAEISRAEVATIFFRMLAESSRQYYWAQYNPYSDVYAHEWFNNAISTLTNAGILYGRPDGNFDPNTSITRAEFAAIASRFYSDEELDTEYDAFVDIEGHWANEEINLACAKGLLNGYPDGTFRPDRNITRAEAIAIVNRLLERYPHKDHLLPGMIEWPDNMNTEAWYYADIQEATNSHTYTKRRNTDGTYEIWQTLESVRDWAALETEWSEYNSSKSPGEVVSSKDGSTFR